MQELIEFTRRWKSVLAITAISMFNILNVWPEVARADIMKNPIEIEPVTSADLGMGWDTTRKRLANVCIDESMERLSQGEVAVDTSPNIEEFSMVRSATEMTDKMGMNMEVALSAMTGIGRFSNATKAGLLKQTSSSRYALTLIGRNRETVPEFLDKEGLKLKKEAAKLLESELTHPQFRDRCGDAFVLGWLIGHELVARLQISEEVRDRLREMDFENDLGISSGSYDLDTLIQISKRSEFASFRKTVDVVVYRTDSKETGTDYSDPERFRQSFFQWQSQVDPYEDGQIVALFVAPYRGNVTDYPPREYLAARTAESYLGWIADALWELKAAEEDAQYVVENPDRHALAVRRSTRAARLAAIRQARDDWAREYESLKQRGAECLQTIKAQRARHTADETLPELPDYCVETARNYHFERGLAAERDRILPPEKSAECGAISLSEARLTLVEEPLSFDINLAMNVQPTGNEESDGNMRVNAVMVSKVQGHKLLTKIFARAAETGGRSSSWKGETGWFRLLDLQETQSGSDCMFHEVRGNRIEVRNVDGFVDYDWQHESTPWGKMSNVIGWIDYEVKKGEQPPKMQPEGRSSRDHNMLYEGVADDSDSLLHKIYCELDKRGRRERVLQCERITLNPARISLVSRDEYAEEQNRNQWSRPVAGATMLGTPGHSRALLSSSLGKRPISTDLVVGGQTDEKGNENSNDSGSEHPVTNLIVPGIARNSISMLSRNNAEQVADKDCQASVQGKIAWNHSGSKRWASSNVDRLCGDAESAAPAECFRRVMHSGGVNRSDNKRWNWRDALELCAGTDTVSGPIRCYRDQLRRGIPTNAAIQACKEP